MNGGLPASVRPDGISAYVGASNKGEVFVSPLFYEAKATGATISKRYRKGQITGMIDALKKILLGYQQEQLTLMEREYFLWL